MVHAHFLILKNKLFDDISGLDRYCIFGMAISCNDPCISAATLCVLNSVFVLNK